MSEVTDKSKIYAEIDNNKKSEFGSNTKAMLMNFIQKTEDKLRKNEEKLHDKTLSEEEINKIKYENIVYSTALRIFKSFG